MIHAIAILAPGIIWTVVVTLFALLIGIVAGLPIALLKRSDNPFLQFIGVTIVEVIRGIPAIVLMFIVFYGVGSGAIRISPLFAAIITLGMIAAVHMAEVYRSAIAAITAGQWEAAAAIGLTRWDTLTRVIIPQSVRTAIPSMATIAIGTLKDSAVASTVGVTDITALAVVETGRSLNGIAVYTVAALLYIVLSAPFAGFSRWLHARLSQRVTR